MILFLRLLPFLAALLQALAFYLQMKSPQTYPYLAIGGVLIVPVVALLLSWQRVRLGDLLEKMLPTVVLHVALAFGLLLIEGQLPIMTIVIISALSTLISLELLFLYAFNPAAYPVNGLSRVNIAYVPIAVWYALSTSAGLIIFVHSSPLIHVAIAAVLGAVLFRTTGHPGATMRQNAIWSLVGFLAGIEIGWIGLLLPLSMGMQGVAGAILMTAALRVRRYLYEPRPARRIAWGEAIGVCLLFSASLLTAKWL